MHRALKLWVRPIRSMMNAKPDGSAGASSGSRVCAEYKPGAILHPTVLDQLAAIHGVQHLSIGRNSEPSDAALARDRASGVAVRMWLRQRLKLEEISNGHRAQLSTCYSSRSKRRRSRSSVRCHAARYDAANADRPLPPDKRNIRRI